VDQGHGAVRRHELGVERLVGPENPPARACVRADLARPEVPVEIMVTAAK
jgi:hypothetical protein